MYTENMYKRFCSCIEKHGMLRDGKGIVVAVSGGADSACLFDLSSRLGVPIYCAHVNHGIRRTAKRDEDFVRMLCKKYNAVFFLKTLNIPALSKERKISEELCGRNERYKFFFEVMNKTQSCAVFTAHNKNDSAESILLHLVRGSGAAGLSGIPANRGDGVFRPLIDFSRREIEGYLRENGLSWVEDETNETDDYTRNFIRHNIMPRFEEINISAADAIVRSGAVLSEDNAYLDALTEKLGAVHVKDNTVFLDKNILRGAPPSLARRAVFKALSVSGIAPSFNDIIAVTSLFEKQSGKRHVFPCGKEARVVYDAVVITEASSIPDYEYPLVRGGKVYIPETGVTVGLYESKPDKPYLRIADSGAPLYARKRREGDRFAPSGMKGTKKIKDFFIDLKIEEYRRDLIPIITDGERIVAVGGLRASEEFKNGSSILYLKIK